MVPQDQYIDNLVLTKKYGNIAGSIVECGVWRGGMIAGVAKLLGDRKYFLLDSFEGLPAAKQLDGEKAVDWQKDVSSPKYYDNCKAEIEYAKKAMQLAGAKNVEFVKGWFNETLPGLVKNPSLAPISILRLDGDWYESTIDCLTHLYPVVAEGGLIIIDDYYMWDGCARAVHDYLSANKLPVRIRQSNIGTCFLIKPAVSAS